MADKHFSLDMTIAQAMQVHPRAAEVFAAFHLGGCAHCHINQVETLDNVCMAYGLDPNELLEALEGIMETADAS
ncbi:MAG TPA: DUF1858 domain-containing protein [Candidatus Hydrogenedentes bacterium]|nr:DUF1858 domain-containing protein [Candidatus Hydrogenedentota bacterium]HOV73680.1 DUF1858 domain-containing protein [Candidatus Hydrogenedentota bacterium]HPC16275.1 DUF1858 domain-containing protein [Candidatus Hydrogenedentota bacterium]HRT21657.1 DUF1858 domain-containing protein [Candidatus Hydrogenedentota bacterium]HRT66893.1 DUF1858 domain-containing protein [Candidatus Hydrogenedentota bacterium]